MNDYLYKALPKDEQDEAEGIYTYGASLAYQFYCGNFSSSAEEMNTHLVSPFDLIDYLEDQAEEMGFEDKLNSIYGGHFSNAFWAELARSVRA